MPNDTELQETQNPELEAEVEVKESDDDLADLDYDQLLEKAKQERKTAQTLKAQKDHFKSKAQKLAEKITAEKPVAPQQFTQQGLSEDEIRLIAKDVPSDDIAYLKALQSGYKAQGITKSLTELNEKDPAIIALRKQREEEEKKRKASLGPSGKSSTRSEETIRNNMSREEHQAVFKKMLENGEI